MMVAFSAKDKATYCRVTPWHSNALGVWQRNRYGCHMNTSPHRNGGKALPPTVNYGHTTPRPRCVDPIHPAHKVSCHRKQCPSIFADQQQVANGHTLTLLEPKTTILSHKPKDIVLCPDPATVIDMGELNLGHGNTITPNSCEVYS